MKQCNVVLSVNTTLNSSGTCGTFVLCCISTLFALDFLFTGGSADYIEHCDDECIALLMAGETLLTGEVGQG